jgi:hypothetical protein
MDEFPANKPTQGWGSHPGGRRSSTASSIRSPCKRRCFLLVAAAVRPPELGWSTLGQLDVRRRRSRRGWRSQARRIATGSSGPGRDRVERGIYLQPNGKYAVCWRHAGRLRFGTVGFALAEARRARLALIAATRAASVPVSPRLRFETVAGWWLERFEAKVAAGERHPRTLEAHRYSHLLPALGRRRVASLTVDDIARLLDALRRKGCSAKTSASAPERDALRAPLRLDRRRPRRAARARRAPAAGAPPPARARPRRDRAPARACARRDRLMLATVL